jgi:hypothetical protein
MFIFIYACLYSYRLWGPEYFNDQEEYFHLIKIINNSNNTTEIGDNNSTHIGIGNNTDIGIDNNNVIGIVNSTHIGKGNSTDIGIGNDTHIGIDNSNVIGIDNSTNNNGITEIIIDKSTEINNGDNNGEDDNKVILQPNNQYTGDYLYKWWKRKQI